MSEKIYELLVSQGGILKTADVVAADISKETFYHYVKNEQLEKAAQGIYVSPDLLTDEMYLLQVQFPKAIYSHEAALYLHDLAEKEPLPLSVTVPAAYNSSSLRKKDVQIYYIKREWYVLGICEIITPGGHLVKVYNRERTLCDIIRKRASMDVAVFTYAVQQYAKQKKKDVPALMRYARIMHIERQTREIMEVLLS